MKWIHVKSLLHYINPWQWFLWLYLSYKRTWVIVQRKWVSLMRYHLSLMPPCKNVSWMQFPDVSFDFSVITTNNFSLTDLWLLKLVFKYSSRFINWTRRKQSPTANSSMVKPTATSRTHTEETEHTLCVCFSSCLRVCVCSHSGLFFL